MADELDLKVKYVNTGIVPVYVNGAFGGTNVGGELVLNFYLERFANPSAELLKQKSDGSVEYCDSEYEDDEIAAIRHINSSVIMNITEAKAFHRWLGRTIEAVEVK